MVLLTTLIYANQTVLKIYSMFTQLKKRVSRPELVYPVKGLNNHEESKA